MKTKIFAVSAIVLSSIAVPAIIQEGTVTGAAGGAVTGRSLVASRCGRRQRRWRHCRHRCCSAAGPGRDLCPPAAGSDGRSSSSNRSSSASRSRKRWFLTPVAEDPTYAYAVVNNQRVIVDPQTHVVVQVVE